MNAGESGLYVALLAVVILFIVALYMCLRNTQVMYDAETAQPRIRHFTRERFAADNQQAPLHDRYLLVLQHLIHKKVLSKPNEKKGRDGEFKESLILPHEKELSLRSSCRSIDMQETSFPLSSWRKTEPEKEDENGTVSSIQKNDILIDTLRSIRSSLNLSFRYDDEESNTLYSPKTCPICCEDYEKGDDIAWSKNEKCFHAFHTDCIVPWLMEHEECPMCRCDYVCIEHDDD